MPVITYDKNDLKWQIFPIWKIFLYLINTYIIYAIHLPAANLWCFVKIIIRIFYKLLVIFKLRLVIFHLRSSMKRLKKKISAFTLGETKTRQTEWTKEAHTKLVHELSLLSQYFRAGNLSSEGKQKLTLSSRMASLKSKCWFRNISNHKVAWKIVHWTSTFASACTCKLEVYK